MNNRHCEIHDHGRPSGPPRKKNRLKHPESFPIGRKQSKTISMEHIEAEPQIQNLALSSEASQTPAVIERSEAEVLMPPPPEPIVATSDEARPMSSTNISPSTNEQLFSMIDPQALNNMLQILQMFKSFK